MKNPLDILKLYTTKGRKNAVLYQDEDEAENIHDYINGTDNFPSGEDAEEQQGFFAPAISQQDTAELTLFHDNPSNSIADNHSINQL